jgi:hypothetical protein
VDIEGAARIGNRVYWIGSHSRDKKGNKQPNRARVFATDLKGEGDDIQVIPVGTAYKDLKKDLGNSAALRQYKLAEAAKLPPQSPGGLNIEGLAATSEGDLLIGFRNPVPENKALIVPLNNPNKVITGMQAKLGPPILLALEGLGIRSIEYFHSKHVYLILAGSAEADKPDSVFRLYEWSGPGSVKATLITELKNSDVKIQPEALFAYANESDAYILSDDGEFTVKGVRCKDLPPPDRSFRGFRRSSPSFDK